MTSCSTSSVGYVRSNATSLLSVPLEVLLDVWQILSLIATFYLVRIGGSADRVPETESEVFRVHYVLQFGAAFIKYAS